MVRFVMRVFLHPMCIALLDLIILVPVLLSIVSVLTTLRHGHLEEPMDILEGVGVILIGWGVAIEERPSLRVMFGLAGVGDASFEAGVDLLCHSSGIGLLIFGLFSEIAVAAVRLPNHIVPTEGFDDVVLCVSTLFVGLSAYVLAQHIVRLLIAMIWGRVPAPHAAEAH
jgi:hypothetical protein